MAGDFQSIDQATQPIQPKQIVKSNGEANPTKEQIAQLRQIASQLMGERSNSAQAHGMLGGIGLGLENATGKITGALDYNRAADLERELNKKTGNDDRTNVGSIVNPDAGNNQLPPTPPSPSASNAPSAASGVAAAAPPFSQSQSPSQDQRVASLGPLPPQPTTTTTPSQGAQPSPKPKLDLGGGVQEKAMRTSARGETGKSSLMGAMFNISPDAGGSRSYGPFGLNSKSGSLNTFIKEHPELGFKSNSPEEWRRVAAVHSDDGLMVEAHKDWYNKHIMSGLDKDLTSRGTPDAIAKDPKVQHYMADRKVQMGDVGLNASVRYANVNAQTPEQWIQRISQADRQRIPYNFPTYLKDNPNNARGLVNRIYQRQGEALAGADPATTAAMVDDIRGRNAAGRAVLSGPDSGSGADFRVAQNTNPNAAPQGSAAQQFGDYLYNRAIHGAPLTPAEARTMWELKMGANPQYNIDEYGRITRSAPGEIPYVYGQQPGHPGKITEDPEAPGAGFITRYNPQTRQYERRLLVPGAQGGGGPSSSIAPTPPAGAPPAKTAPNNVPVNTVPPPKPGGGEVVKAPTAPAAVAQSQPTAPAQANSNPLTVNPPGVPAGTKAGSKLALASLNPFESVAHAVGGGPTKVAQAIGTPTEMPQYNIEKPNTAEEVGVRQALDQAYANPPKPLKMRNAWSEAAETLNNPNATDFEKLDALGNIKGTKAASQAALEDKMKTENKGFGELQKNIRDTEKQSIHLAPELKAANQLLNSPDFEAGPANELVTNVRGLREEAANAFRRMGEAAKARGDDPSTYNNLADWIFDPKKSPSATTNQVYTKILSGSILQSLRGMLGPNAGQFRVQELKMLEQAFGNPNLTLNANKTVMAMIDKMNDRNILIGKMANEYDKNKRGLDASFEDALSDFETKHPVFTPQEVMKLAGIGATGKTPEELAAPAPVVTNPANQTPTAPRGFRPNQPGTAIPGLEDYMKKRGIQLPGVQ